MNAETEHHGACLCGAVTITAKLSSEHVSACHCATCRKWGGGPLLAIESKNGVKIKGSAQVAVFESSEWAERGFCNVCGTHLFYRLKEGEHYAIPVGLFNEAERDQWQLTEQIFIEQKPSFYSFSQETKNLTGEEVFAQYAPQ